MSVRTERMEDERMTIVVLMDAIRISSTMKEGIRPRAVDMIGFLKSPNLLSFSNK